ncbi:MAG TPA: GAF domain-containing protein [Pyrinomonadaceae bacterium]|jgi:GAF domain-containing protein|nr:GAF domain-containing protein [Pyrinomonadaceae bacterium]
MKAPLPDNEAARLETLRQYQILDTDPEETFNDLTRLAAYICGTPIALITLIDMNRQWFKARVGMSQQETSRDISFCSHAILQTGPLVVRDAMDDARFARNPMVLSDPYIRFYAGSPLVTPEGFVLGTLCVIDRVPRDLTQEQVAALRALGNQVITLLEARREIAFLTRALDKYKRAAEDFRAKLDEKDESGAEK